jgi:hypothetical protein
MPPFLYGGALHKRGQRMPVAMQPFLYRSAASPSRGFGTLKPRPSYHKHAEI